MLGICKRILDLRYIFRDYGFISNSQLVINADELDVPMCNYNTSQLEAEKYRREPHDEFSEGE
jgi:hypothetical protein